MSIKRVYRIIASGVCVQLLILWAQIRRYQSVLWYGTPVLVKTAWVDPRDIFRGDYVQLGYDISSLSGKDYTWRSESVVYIIPEMNSGIVVGVASLQPQRPSSGLYFRAHVNRASVQQTAVIEYMSGKSKQTLTHAMYDDQFASWDWVSLTYRASDSTYPSISRIEFSGNESDWVVLSPGETAVQKRRSSPDSTDSDVREYTGRVVSIGDRIVTLNLDYGVDRFFVKEWTGVHLQNRLAGTGSYAGRRVGSAGNIVLEYLLVDGSEIR